MADRTRDLWDVLQKLTNLTTPDIETVDEVLDAYQTPTPDALTLSDGVSLPTLFLHHTGVYFWNNPSMLWNRFQWG